MSSLHLPPRYSAEDAAQVFWRPRAKNLFGLLRPRPVKMDEDGRLPGSLELIWMPVYAFRMRLVRGDKTGTLWVSVDASFGGFALFERMDALEEGEFDGESFEPVLTVPEAERFGRDGVVRYFLRKRGGPKPSDMSVEEHCLYHTPVWVYYFRRGKKIDLAVLDGYTGERMGSRMRIAVLEAFIRRRQERINER